MERAAGKPLRNFSRIRVFLNRRDRTTAVMTNISKEYSRFLRR